MLTGIMNKARLWASGPRDAKPAPDAAKPRTAAAAYKGQQAPDDAERTCVRNRAAAIGDSTDLARPMTSSKRPLARDSRFLQLADDLLAGSQALLQDNKTSADQRQGALRASFDAAFAKAFRDSAAPDAAISERLVTGLMAHAMREVADGTSPQGAALAISTLSEWAGATLSAARLAELVAEQAAEGAETLAQSHSSARQHVVEFLCTVLKDLPLETDNTRSASALLRLCSHLQEDALLRQLDRALPPSLGERAERLKACTGKGGPPGPGWIKAVTHLLSGCQTSAGREADRSAVDVCVADVCGSARPLSAQNIRATACGLSENFLPGSAGQLRAIQAFVRALGDQFRPDSFSTLFGEDGIATSVAQQAGVDLPMAITGSLSADAPMETLLHAAGLTDQPEGARHRMLQLIAVKVAQLDITPTHPPINRVLIQLHAWVDAQPGGAAVTWLALADALFLSREASVGKLSQGLLAPSAVRSLVDAVAGSGAGQDDAQRTAARDTIARLLALPQERCGRDLVEHAVRAMGRLAGPAAASTGRQDGKASDAIATQATQDVAFALAEARRCLCAQRDTQGQFTRVEIRHAWQALELRRELEAVYEAAQPAPAGAEPESQAPATARGAALGLD